MGNTAAEFNLLAGLCSHPHVFFEISEFLSTDDFTQKAHKQFFIVLQRLIMDAHGDGDILITEGSLLAKAAELNLKDFYKVCDEGDLITACVQHTSSTGDVVQSFRQVKKETVRRVLGGKTKHLMDYLNDTSDDIDTIIAKVEDELITANSKLQGATENPIINLAHEALDILEDLAERPGQLGLDIGLPTWQRAIGAIRNGAVTFVAASTKQGKSQLGVRAAIEVAKMGYPVLICDSELNKLAQSVRAFGQFAEVNYEVWETGYWKADPDTVRADGYDETFVQECAIARRNFRDKSVREAFQKLPLYYHSINGTTARDSIPFLRRWVLQHVGKDLDTKVPQCLIVWDYIKLADINEVKSLGVGAHDILAADCTALHDFAEGFNLPILAFGQTNRQLDESLDCIAGAKKISELCDSVTLFKAKTPEELAMDSNGSHLMRIFATRYGKGVKTHINLEGDLSIGKFTDRGVHVPTTVARNNDDDDDEDSSDEEKPSRGSKKKS